MFYEDLENITSSLVNGDERMNFLPNSFGEEMILIAENVIYQFADILVNNYSGGYWDFYTLSNGGFYLSMSDDMPIKIEVPFGNNFSGEMSADAAGIVISLFAINYLASKYENENLTKSYYKLRDFASFHIEASLILGAID